MICVCMYVCWIQPWALQKSKANSVPPPVWCVGRCWRCGTFIACPKHRSGLNPFIWYVLLIPATPYNPFFQAAFNAPCLYTYSLTDTVPSLQGQTLFNGPCLTANTRTHLTALFLGLPGWAGTRKVKPIWILLKQETVSGSGICWTICKSASRSRQITTPAPTTHVCRSHC